MDQWFGLYNLPPSTTIYIINVCNPIFHRFNPGALCGRTEMKMSEYGRWNAINTLTRAIA